MSDVAVLLELRGLRKSFPSGGTTLHVLRGADLSVDEGEFVTVVGQSGSGKSTLLHLVGALDHPDSGQVLFAGADVFAGRRCDVDRYRNREVGFVFQFHHLMAEFSALENVMMPALVARLAPAEARERAMALLGEVGLAPRASHRPGQLSGGEQQRVALARALVMGPRLLLADEPTGNLDRDTSGAVFDLLRELTGRKRLTVVMVTHNRELAAASDRTVRLESGVIAPAR